MSHVVKFGQNAALELVLSGLEAFNKANLTAPKFRAVETLGHLWGYRRKIENDTYHVIEHVSISALAKRSANSVSCEPSVIRLKHAVATYLRPELTLLGDFHTHPYRSKSDVAKNRGWEDSEDDRRLLLCDEDLWKLSVEPLMIVLAICRLDKVHASDQTEFRTNVLRFNVAEYSFWLSAYIGTEMNGARKVSARSKSNVNVRPLPLEVWNNSSEKLADYSV